MKKFFAKKVNNSFIIEGDELAHFNVLRCSLGEQILCLGSGEEDYLCEIVNITKKQAEAKLVTIEKNTKNPKKEITVYQGLLKGEKADLVVQKLTELGISNLVMFESNFTIAKANVNKIDRLNKISQEACKQCGRNLPLNIHNPIKFGELINELKNYDLVLFANEKNVLRAESEIISANKIAIIVGSEGGFSDNEIEQIYGTGAKNFGLGERILRAETASIAIASIVGYLAGV